MFTGYAYDAQGNITARGTRGYYFDLGNRLQLSNGVESYQYDGLGRRTGIYKNTGVNQTQVYSPDGALLFGTYQAASNASSTRYIYLAGKQIAETDSATGTKTYAHTDALGSPVAKTNAAGAVLSRTRYEAYGYTAAGSVPTTIGFTGHVNDADTGLVYMQQRYYDPVAGRFLSVDPVTTDVDTGNAFNRFNYAQNNPYRYTDPDGRESVGEFIDRKATESASAGNSAATYGWAFAGVAWKAFGSEGISQIADKGAGATMGDKVSAGVELLAVVPGGKLLGEAAVAAKGGVAVTDDAIRAALKGSDLKTAQGAISKPAVENYVRRLEAGEVAPAIKVDGKVIVDGNHRYVAGRLVGKEPAQTAGALSPNQAARTQPVQNLKIDPSDWGNR